MRREQAPNNRCRTLGCWVPSTLAYHEVAASWLIVDFFVNTRPGYCRESGVLVELALTILIYPLAIPRASGGWLAFYVFRRRRRAKMLSAWPNCGMWPTRFARG